jgi:hypothetical protein
MPIGTGIVYNAGDLILSQVSGSGTSFLETKIAAATSSLIYFDNTARINSASLSSITVGTSSYVSGSRSIITNLTASNISASSITGSLFGTSSWSNNSVSSSYALTSSVATNETLGTVTGRGASTGTQITVATSTGGTMYTGRKAGAGYADGVSGATFKSITDNPNGASYAFASYYSGSTGFNSFYVSALGDGYFSGSVGIGTTSPAYKLDVSGSSRFGYQTSDTHQFTGSVSFTDGLFLTNLTASNVSASNTLSASNVWFGNSMVYVETMTTGSLTSPDITFTSTATTGSDVMFRINTTVLTGSAVALQINASGSQASYAISASNGIIAGTNFIATNITASNISASATGSFGIVGIGTASPAYKLDVNGNANFTNGFYTNTDASSTSYFVGANGTRPIIFQNNTGASYDFGFKFFDSNTFTIVGGNTLANPTTDLVSFTYDGKVGIGTTNPSALLHLYTGSIGSTAYPLLIDNSSGGAGVNVVGFGFANGGIMKHSITTAIYGNDYMAFNVGQGASYNQERMRIDSTGNVGIGTTTVSRRLHTYVTTGPVMRLQSSGSNASIEFIPSSGHNRYNWLIGAQQNISDAFEITPSTAINGTTFSTPSLLITSAGNVGIGTTSPFATLQVAGNISGSSFTSSVNNAVGFLGTSSWAQNVVTASYLVPTNNYIVNSLTASNISASGYISASKFWGLTGTFTNVSSSGPVVVSGSNAYIQLLPVGNIAIPTNTTASYIYVSGSTNDLYFTQYQGPFTNTTRLRWLESNMYTGILFGGQISSTPGSTTFNVKSGSGLIVSMNATTGSDPYPTIRQINWPDYNNQPITNSGSAKITYVGLDNTGQIVQQTNAWGSTDINQWDTEINLGVVLTLSGSVSTGVFNSPQISYGYAQKTDDFTRAFGPLKISGHTLQASGSGLSIQKTGGTSFREGANYYINPNHPSTVVENAITASKIYRYYLSGSTPIIDTGINNAGYTTLDNKKYVNLTNGQLVTIGGSGNNHFTIQRIFWVPNSPTNAFIAYYGNGVYTTLLEAENAIDTESFTEAPNTALNAIFVAYVIMEGNATNLTTVGKSYIQQGGLFRSVGGVGSSGTSPVPVTLASLSDVAITGVTQGDLLVYGNGTQWNNSKTLVGAYTLSGSLVTNDGVSVNSLSASVVSASIIRAGTLTSTSITSSGPIIYDNAVLLDYGSVSTPVVSTNYVVLQNLTGSYNSAFFDYFASSGSNFRAGTVIAGWSGSNINYTEYATTDVGNTNQLSMSVDLSGSFVRLLTRVSTTINWNIKSAGRYL